MKIIETWENLRRKSGGNWNRRGRWIGHLGPVEGGRYSRLVGVGGLVDQGFLLGWFRRRYYCLLRLELCIALVVEADQGSKKLGPQQIFITWEGAVRWSEFWLLLRADLGGVGI